MEPTGQECPDIAGVYQDRTGSESLRYLLLSDNFLPSAGTAGKYSNPRKAVINQSDANSVAVEITDDDGATVHRIFRRDRDEIACEDGMISFPTRIEGSPLILGAGWITPYLAKDHEGWLVVKMKEKGGGLLFFVVPVGASMVRWHRYSPM